MATIRERKKGDGSAVFHTQVRMSGFPSRTASFPARRMAERWAKTIEGRAAKARWLHVARESALTASKDRSAEACGRDAGDPGRVPRQVLARDLRAIDAGLETLGGDREGEAVHPLTGDREPVPLRAEPRVHHRAQGVALGLAQSLRWREQVERIPRTRAIPSGGRARAVAGADCEGSRALHVFTVIALSTAARAGSS
jgi:hypothetical protein